jgi:hypothetical protein
MTEKMKDAMKDDSRTSDTPYCPVDCIKCKENAIPGSTLTMGSMKNVRTARHHEKRKFLEEGGSLGKEDEGGGRDDSIIPGILPVAPVPRCASTYIPYDARTNFDLEKAQQMQTGCSSTSISCRHRCNYCR